MEATLIETGTTLSASCARKDLLDAVQTVGHAVSTRTSLPILQHILVESTGDHLRLSATDMELGISLKIPAIIKAEGALTVPAKLLTDLLASLPEQEVSMAVDHSHAMRLTCDRADYRLLGLPAEEYPKLPEVKQASRIRVPQALLRDMIRQTIFACSTDETRAILTGVLVSLEDGTLRMVATDTHRLALRTTTVADSEGAFQAIVPARALNLVKGMLSDSEGDVDIILSQTQAQFVTPNGVGIVSRLIDGQYPNYMRVIPAPSDNRFTIQTQVLARAVKRAEVLVKDAAHRVIFKTEDSTLKITAESATSGNAKEELEVAVDGAGITVAFNGAYLLDVLSVIDVEGVTVEMQDPMKPGVVRPVVEKSSETVDEYLCVMMPMQLT